VNDHTSRRGFTVGVYFPPEAPDGVRDAFFDRVARDAGSLERDGWDAFVVGRAGDQLYVDREQPTTVTAGTPLVCSDERHAAKVAALEAEVAQLRAHILNIDAHATPYGDLPDDPGYAGTYLLTAGALHRAIGKVGHTSPSCTAEAELAALQADCPDPIECDHEAMVGQLAEDVRYLLGYEGPRHAHLKAGVWDDTGLPCSHCARLDEVRRRLAVVGGGRAERCGAECSEQHTYADGCEVKLTARYLGPAVPRCPSCGDAEHRAMSCEEAKQARRPWRNLLADAAKQAIECEHADPNRLGARLPDLATVCACGEVVFPSPLPFGPADGAL